MISASPSRNERVVGEGITQLLFESRFKVKPSMSKVLGEKFDVEITDYTVFFDKVLVKGIVEQTVFYMHPHLGKKEDNNKKDGSKNDESKTDGNKNNEDKKTEKKRIDSHFDFFKWVSEYQVKPAQNSTNKQESSSKNKDSEKSSDDGKKCTKEKDLSYDGKKCIKENDSNYFTGWCARVDSHEGIVHFFQESLEFAGVVGVPGAMPGDSCIVRQAEVRDYDAFRATETDNDGLVKAGKQMFIINVGLQVVRNEAKVNSVKRENKAILVDSWDEK